LLLLGTGRKSSFPPKIGTKVPGQSVKKADKTQGLFDFGMIAA